MILADVLTEARRLLQDTNASASLQRYSDAHLLGTANQVLQRMALLRPDLFSYIGEIECEAEEVLQTAPDDSLRLMEIFRVQGGPGVRETNKAILDQTYPTWADDAAGDCLNWMRHPKNANRFFIYPKAPVGQILIGEYAKAPATYDADTTVTELPDTYFPVVVDGLVGLIESTDNENVTSGRATMFMQSFMQMLSATLSNQSITDEPASTPGKKGGP